MVVSPAKFLFNISQLALAFNKSKPTVKEMLHGINPSERKGKSFLYHIGDVARLVETRDAMQVEKFTNEQYKEKPHNTNSTHVDDSGDVITDPEQMSAIQRINYYKAEDLRQSAMLKQHKNDMESGKLMVATEVERTIAEAFKKIALVMDTLPDLLECDGIIGSNDIERVINVLDNSRKQLAIDLTGISPSTASINARGDW